MNRVLFMKIGFLAHVPLPGNVGGSIRSMELSRSLAMLGEEVHLYGRLEEDLPCIENLYFHNYPSRGLEILRAVFSFLRDFRDYDVIYERFQYLFNNLGFFIAKILGKPYVAEIHGFPVDELKIIWKEDRLRQFRSVSSPSLLSARILPKGLLEGFETGILKNSSLVIVTSDGTREILEEKGVPADIIRLVPNAVDLRKFNTSVKHEDLREKDEVVVSYIGSLFNRGVGTVFEVAKLLRDDNVRFVLVGPGPHDLYRKLIEREGLSNVVLRPPVKHGHVPSVIAGSDIMLAIYSLEDMRFKRGFHYSPLKIYEYLSMEKPVIASRTKQLEACFKDGVNIFFVPPDSPGDLADKILYVIEHKGLAKRVAGNGRNLVLQGHTWEKRAGVLIKYLESVAT